jgi:hypothetical protein
VFTISDIYLFLDEHALAPGWPLISILLISVVSFARHVPHPKVTPCLGRQ